MRHIDQRFIKDLLCGELQYFFEKVKSNRDTLSLEVRDGYINIYYKGGNLLRIRQQKTKYTFEFDAQYCKNKENDANFSLLNDRGSHDAEAYKQHFDLMMQEMTSWFVAHPKPERDYQQELLVNNPEIIDIEYQIGKRMRLDMLYVAENKLFIVENKFGNGAIGGKAGMSKHYQDICDLLNDSKTREEVLDSVCHISQAKKALGLTDTAIEKNDIKGIEILFLMANYIPKGKALSNELAKMNGTVPASILMISGDQVKIDLSQAESILEFKSRLEKV